MEGGRERERERGGVGAERKRERERARARERENVSFLERVSHNTKPVLGYFWLRVIPR